MQFSPPIRGEGEGAYTSIDSTFNIRFSPRSAAPLDHPPCAVCPSVLTERRKRFRWLAPMMDGQKRCRFYRQRFILEEATSSDDPSLRFLPLFPFRANCLDNFVGKNILRCSKDTRRADDTREEERWFIERESRATWTKNRMERG